MTARKAIPMVCRRCKKPFPSIRAFLRHEKTEHFSSLRNHIRSRVRRNKVTLAKPEGEKQ